MRKANYFCSSGNIFIEMCLLIAPLFFSPFFSHLSCPVTSSPSPLLDFVSVWLSLVRCTSQLPAAADDYLVREPAGSEAAVRRCEVLDGAGGHCRFALPGRCLLDNAMQQGMNMYTILNSSSVQNSLPLIQTKLIHTGLFCFVF